MSDVDWKAIEVRVAERIAAMQGLPGDVVFMPVWDNPEDFAFSATVIKMELLGCRQSQLRFEHGSPDYDLLQMHFVDTLAGVPENALKMIIDGMSTAICELENELEAKDV